MSGLLRRANLVYFLMTILIIGIGALGYDNYKAHEKIVELEVESQAYAYYMGEYMIQFARCQKYVQIMHETCKCEGE